MSEKWIYSADLIREIKSVKPKESDWRKDNFEGYSLQEIRNRAALNVYNDIIYIVEKAPPSNVAPVVRGHWSKEMRFTEDFMGNRTYGFKCSVCGKIANALPFCGNCGARMDQEAQMTEEGMDIIYCEKCHKWFDANDEYDEILIAKKIGDIFKGLSFCQDCGSKLHKAINIMLRESESNGEIPEYDDHTVSGLLDD